MSFIAGTGKTNVDILYAGLKRLPQLGEELYSDGFKLCLGGGVPGTASLRLRPARPGRGPP